MDTKRSFFQFLLPWFPLISFAFVSSITPGPNNLLLASSGAAFGFTRTIPHMLGVASGFFTLLVFCGIGIGAALMALPGAALALKVFGSGYLLWLAWKLRKNVAGNPESCGAPFSFWSAFLFQAVNPKGWFMAVSGAAAFLPASSSLEWSAVLSYAILFCVVGAPCLVLWTLLGYSIRRWLGNPALSMSFSIVMILLTLYSALAIWL